MDIPIKGPRISCIVCFDDSKSMSEAITDLRSRLDGVHAEVWTIWSDEHTEGRDIHQSISSEIVDRFTI